MLRHLPNALTALRLIIAPFLALMLVEGYYRMAFASFALAGLSDALDGYLAKRLAHGSKVGAWLDPAADKALMLVTFVTLAYIAASPVWLASLVIARDVAIVAGILLLKALGARLRIAPLLIGKACTVIQIAYVALILLQLALHIELSEVSSVLGLIVATATIASWLAYGQVLMRALALRRGTA